MTGNKALSVLTPFFDTHIAVCSFFIISGCLIANSYIRTSTFKKYLKKRALRLLPAYIFVILICALGLWTVSSLSFSEYFSSLALYKYVGANLAFLNFLQPSLPGVFESPLHVMNAVNGALWTIKVEVLFYICIPIFIFFIGKQIQAKKARNIFWITVIYLFGILWREFFNHLSDSSTDIYNLLSHQMPAYLNYFASGIALLYFGDFFKKHKIILTLLALLIFSAEYYLGLDYLKAISLAVLIYFIAYSIPSFNNFGKYGDFSYGIYIFHFPVIQLLVGFGFYNMMNPFLALILTILISLAIAVFSWNFIEKPFLSRK